MRPEQSPKSVWSVSHFLITGCDDICLNLWHSWILPKHLPQLKPTVGDVITLSGPIFLCIYMISHRQTCHSITTNNFDSFLLLKINIKHYVLMTVRQEKHEILTTQGEIQLKKTDSSFSNNSIVTGVMDICICWYFSPYTDNTHLNETIHACSLKVGKVRQNKWQKLLDL